ncbi:hypothetical protein BDR04DRAFT_267091 [Suillus decipiens]|nr:hypothetical protein BDR04DRAFT_267091 [Suillus decipiens]
MAAPAGWVTACLSYALKSLVRHIALFLLAISGRPCNERFLVLRRLLSMVFWTQSVCRALSARCDARRHTDTLVESNLGFCTWSLPRYRKRQVKSPMR